MDLKFLLFLQSIRLNIPNFFSDIMMFVSNAALLLQFLIPLFLFWCVSKRKAIFVAYALGFAMVFNQFLKNIFCVWRPWIRDVRIQPYANAKESATGYSFPSGHTQIASSTFGGVSYCCWREKKFALVMIFFAFLVGFSRMFLGCHTPQDVFVAFAEGALSVMGMHFLLGWTWSAKEREKIVFGYGAIFVLVVILIVEFKPYPNAFGYADFDVNKMKIDCYSSAGILLGILTGVFLEGEFVNFEIETNWTKKTIQFAAGSALVVLIYVGVKSALSFMGAGERAENFFASFFAMFFIFFIGPAIIKFLKSLEQRRV